MLTINPYLGFTTNCREAMEFYKAALGAELTLQTVGESPMKDTMPAEMHDMIMHASLSKDGQTLLMASDMMNKDYEPIKGTHVTLSLNCTSEEEINTCFAKLSEGGTVTMPLATQFWGATFGMLMDKFGMPWMLNYDKK